METLRIIAMCLIAAVTYGVIHDQLTARICLEYFTVFHVRMSESDSPTVHALIWGVLATWWVGFFLGLALATVSRAGNWPKVTARQLAPWLLTLIAASAMIATVAGGVGTIAAASGAVSVSPRWADRIPVEQHVHFLVCGWVHTASYLVAFVGGGMLIGWTIVLRKRAARAPPPSPPA